MKEEATLEEALMTNAGVLIEIPTEKIQHLPAPPITQAELMWSPFQEAFQHSQRVDVNGLLDGGCTPIKEMAKGTVSRQSSDSWLKIEVKWQMSTSMRRHH